MAYSKKNSLKFLVDMKEAGYKVEHYFGPNLWEGPAVRVPDHHGLADVVASTSVKLTWINEGVDGYVLHPVKSDPGTKVMTAGGNNT